MNIWDKAIEFLVSSIGQSAVDAWRQTSAIDTDLSNLQTTLLKSTLLIERSECWRLPKYRPIDELLPHLKDAVYEAETIVDELKYQRLKNEFESSFLGTNFVRKWMSNFPITVRRVLDRLNNVYDEMKETCDSRGIPENPNQFSQTARPVTSTILDVPKVYGREEELKKVISLLRVSDSGSGRRIRQKKLHVSESIGESSRWMDNKGKVLVLSIVGMGGVGKTTLAQMVCNERTVESLFDLIMWVCVSDNFDLIRLTKEILESATNKECNFTNPDTVEKKLVENLKSKRFLLVLDDVWCQEWQSLLAVMNRVEKGGVVMVTTRSLNCVKNITTGIDTKTIINLEGLEEHIYWDFFRCCAFGSVENANNYPALEIIGKEICGRLKGSPLAAKTIGGLLRINMDERHWRSIKDSKIWQLQQNERDILPVLQLSYQYLPSHLKKCFSFCSLYPKDFKFTKQELTKLWVMQGFIELQAELNIYWENPYIKEAEVCFHELVQRDFFQKAASSHSDEFVIHDLMHDACQSITKDECFCIEDADFENNVSINIRHLSTFMEEIITEQMKLCKYEKLLSMKVSPRSRCQWVHWVMINEWSKKLTNIRSLSIPEGKFKSLPKSIGKLTHLQYFDISFSRIENLPESFWSLYNLLYLNMEGCSNFKVFPEGLKKLVNLRFLYLPLEKHILVGHIENFARKIDCRNMSFEVNTHSKIENLKFMNNLRGGLTIKNVELVLSKQTALEAHLGNKQLINQLNLHWSEYKDPAGGQSARVERRDEEVLQGLCPHPNLKELQIVGYGGTNLSRIGWLEPNYLPGLQKLSIQYCPKLVSIAVESFGQFVFLKELTIWDCPKLTCPDAMVLPPSIKSLSLKSCRDIVQSIPSFLKDLVSLEKLLISNCPSLVSFLAEVACNLKSLSDLSFQDCVALQLLGGLQFLAALKDLCLKNCPSLVYIPAEVTGNLKSLRKLNIVDCTALQSLGGLQFLVALEDLNLENCPRIESMTAELLRNLKSLSTLRIRECAGLQSIGGLEFLVSLESLYITSCPCLISIQADVPSNLKSLTRVGVSNCAELQSLGRLLYLTSLEDINIHRCPKLQETSGRKILQRSPLEMRAELPSSSSGGNI